MTQDFVDLFFDPFMWDKKSYKFNRDEKDLNPYSIINTKDNVTIVHNVLGLDKKDLKLSRKNEGNNIYIVIAGKTKDEITGKEYSINSKFAVDERSLDMNAVQSTMKNGLLYITIPYKRNKTLADKEIEIL